MKHPLLLLALTILSCAPRTVRESSSYPPIYPDYTEVTVPEGIAPLTFRMADDRKFSTMTERRGDTLWTTVTARERGSREAVRYAPFPIICSRDPIDPYIAYRLIEPGYENWQEMGIWQRELASYRETPIITNRVNGRGCVNCHTFSSGSPDKFLLHARGTGGGTIFVDGDSIKKIDLTTVGAKKQGVYPFWHPGGRYVAFASCRTYQEFFISGTQPIEVFDLWSDIILMDTATDSTWCVPGLSEPDVLETFPTWSPDGSTLYCCCAPTDSAGHDDWSRNHYCLKAIPFSDGRFTAPPRTVWEEEGASASLPRINGEWLLFTRSAYGTFPIWHREADLCLMNLTTGEVREADELNSDEAESYHSWSSEGRWVLFSSRRDDGRYTRLYIAHFDGEGHFSKPFMLPQKDPDHNRYRLRSYNVPDFVKGRVRDRHNEYHKLFR